MRRGFARVRRQRVKIRKGRTRGAVPTSKRALRAPSSVGKRGGVELSEVHSLTGAVRAMRESAHVF